MNLKFTAFALLSLLLAASVSGQQNDTTYWTGYQLVEHGIKLYDKGNYEESLRFFKQVSKCDPEYANACYESAMAYENTKEYALGLLKVNEADSLQPDNVGTITMKGSLLDDLGRQSEAIDLLEKARKRWPYNHNLLYNLAIVYVNVYDYHKAEQLLSECVLLSPYHAGTHFLLGRINHAMGRSAQSVLAYNMGLIMSPSSANVTKFERTITGQSDVKPAAYRYPYDAGFDASHWKELARFCNSGIAFRKDFPYDAFPNFLINRQSLMLFRLMEYKEADTTIYNRFYVRFFKEVLNRNEVSVLFGMQLQNIENKEIDAWNKANEKKQGKFIEFAQSAINEWREYAFSPVNEKNKVKTRLFGENGKTEYIGTQLISDKPSKEGSYIEIHSTGYVREKGTYKNNELTGACAIFHPDGSVRQELNFVDGELDGVNKTYNENGKLSGIYPRVKGKSEGTEILYTSSGRIYRKQDFANGLAEGKSYNLYSASGWTLEQNFSKGKMEGPYTERWLNGKLKSEGNYKDSLLNGPLKKWYSNGKPESVNDSKNDYLVGPFTLFHSNGAKKSEGAYNDSTEFTGDYAEYSRTGKLKMKQTGYVNGKISGTQTDYYDNGNKKDVYVFDNDVLKSIVCYDINGKEIYKADTQNGVLAFKHYYENGTVRREGNYVNGKREGEWREYSGGGVVVSLENWKENMQSGNQKTYFPSGDLKAEFYCDSNYVEGPYRWYYPNGKLSSVAVYQKGKANGECKLYYSNGQLKSEYYLTDNELTGRRFDYSIEGKLESISEYDEDNIVTKETLYTDGKLNKVVSYTTDSTLVEVKFPNGKTQIRFKLIDGWKEGTVESFYPNGKLASSQVYLRGKLHGPSKNWNPMGSLTSLFNYNLDKVEGNTYFYRNGKVSDSDYYEEGKEQGDFREYYPNGKVMRIIPYTDDEREGEYSYFSPDSVKLVSFFYESGSLVAVGLRNKQGNFERIQASNPAGVALTGYYPDGTVAAIVPLVKGYLNGTLTLFYPNGNKIRERVYKNDYLEGVSTDYYANGKIRHSLRYANDDKTGEFVSYSETGLKTEEGQYISDVKNGTWIYYDATGKPSVKAVYQNDMVYEMQ